MRIVEAYAWAIVLLIEMLLIKDLGPSGRDFPICLGLPEHSLQFAVY